jgi:hypothetical protein
MTTVGIYTDLPQVVAIIGKSDSGEYGNATCPHCGAEGRYVYHFLCADGTTRGAMAGCFTKFPKHRFVAIHKRILDKKQEYARNNWNLPTWDATMLKAIEDFGNGLIAEHQADAIINDASRQSAAYRQRRFGRRR